MNCVCINCFQDKNARRFIRKNGIIGDCDFCGSKNRKVLPAYRLKALFEEVVALYRPYEPMTSEFGNCGGGTLAECMEGWEIFAEDSEKRVQNRILNAIIGYDPREDISASDDWEAKSRHWSVNPLHERWPWFADHLKRVRRFIIEDDPTGEIVRPEVWVPDLLKDADAIRVIKKNSRLFRGRLGFVGEREGRRDPLPALEMGAPPPRLARAGRANSEGIPVLYCTFEPETAIIETGRFPGAVVSLRVLRTRIPLRLANLKPKNAVLEPLGTPNLAEEVRRGTLLGSLGSALGEPVHPEDSGVEYAPTQYLAEVIRSAGYDGMCFPSALNSEGTNVVIFNPADVRVTPFGGVFELDRAEYTIHPRPLKWTFQKRQ